MSNTESIKQDPAGLIASITSLDLLLSSLRERYCCIAQEDSPYAQFAETNLSPDQMILISDSEELSDDYLISSVTISDDLVRKGVNAFLPSCFTSSTLENLQQKLEDKIFFDVLLRSCDCSVPPGRVLSSLSDIDSALPFPGVLQIPESWGGLGTYRVSTQKELTETIKKNLLGFPLLYRAWISGVPVGVTVIIGETDSIFSALRVQLFLKQPGERDLFLGVQWIARHQLPPIALQALERELGRLVTALQKESFQGYANIDCVLTERNAYIVECNPRQSLCTCQLTQRLELCHGLDALEEFVRCFTDGNPSTSIRRIPDTDYQGTVIDGDQFGRRFAGRILKSVWECGCYDAGMMNFRTRSIDDAQETDVLLSHTIQPQTLLDPTSDLGVTLADFPIAHVSSGETTLTPKGKILLDNLEKLVASHLTEL